MQRYGSDKPDLRFSIPNVRIDHKLPPRFISELTPLTAPLVEAMILKTSSYDKSSKVKPALLEFLNSPQATTFHDNPHGGPAILPYGGTKENLWGLSALGPEAAKEINTLLSPSDGDVLVIQARPPNFLGDGATPLGNLRNALQKYLLSKDLLVPEQTWAPLWVVDFPLFTPTSASSPGQGGRAGLSSTHHPFTSPKTAVDVDQLRIDPTKVIADHYDLVINGVELGGGSRRIHDADLQTYVLKDVLRLGSDKLAHFDHLIDVLGSACPPHAGIALGMDRLVAMLTGCESVRDVIAFPKSGKGDDPLMKSPAEIDAGTLRTYHLKIAEEENDARAVKSLDVVCGNGMKEPLLASEDHQS